MLLLLPYVFFARNAKERWQRQLRKIVLERVRRDMSSLTLFPTSINIFILWFSNVPKPPFPTDAVAIFFPPSPNNALLIVRLNIRLKQNTEQNIFKQNYSNCTASVHFLPSRMSGKIYKWQEQEKVLTFWCLAPRIWAAYASAPVQDTSQSSQRNWFWVPRAEVLLLLVFWDAFNAASFFLCFWPSKCSL